MGYGDYYWGVYRGYYRDLFPHFFKDMFQRFCRLDKGQALGLIGFEVWGIVWYG